MEPTSISHTQSAHSSHHIGFLHSDVCYDVVSVRRAALPAEETDGLFPKEDIGGSAFDALHQGGNAADPAGYVARAQLRDAYVYMCATRGLPDLEDPRDCLDIQTDVYAFAVPFIWIINLEEQPS